MFAKTLPLLAAAAVLSACGDVEGDDDTAFDATPDSEVVDAPESYEPPVVEDGSTVTTRPEDPDMSQTEPQPAPVE